MVFSRADKSAGAAGGIGARRSKHRALGDNDPAAPADLSAREKTTPHTNQYGILKRKFAAVFFFRNISGAARVAVDLKRAPASIGLVNSDVIQKLRAGVRDVPDFPKKGIVFKDITPILKDG